MKKSAFLAAFALLFFIGLLLVFQENYTSPQGNTSGKAEKLAASQETEDDLKEGQDRTTNSYGIMTAQSAAAIGKERKTGGAALLFLVVFLYSCMPVLTGKLKSSLFSIRLFCLEAAEVYLSLIHIIHQMDGKKRRGLV